MTTWKPHFAEKTSLNLSNEEIEFISEEDYFLTIRPWFTTAEPPSFSRVKVVQFKTQADICVPFWLGLNLKKRNKCTVIPPRWLEEHYLEEILRTEQVNGTPQKLPHFHFIEIANLLCMHARDDIKGWNVLFDLVQQIRTVRLSKIRDHLKLKGLEVS